MKRDSQIPGKLLYALLFVVIIPVVLWYWAKLTEHLVRFPAIASVAAGWILLVCGGILLAWGMLAIVSFGKGLPMNLHPPAKLVKKGPYRIVKHPIYWGFGILMIGFFILTKSASGLWLVTPITLLSMTALVLGYENIDLERRFPNDKVKTIFDLPANDDQKPSLSSRIVSLLQLYAILFLGNFLTLHLVGEQISVSEQHLSIMPIFDNSNLLILSNIFILTIPFLLNRNSLLRSWVIVGKIAISVALFVAILYPLIGAQYLPATSAVMMSGWEQFLTIGMVPVFMLLCSLKSIWDQSRKLFYILGVIVLFLIAIQTNASSAPIPALFTSIAIFLIAVNYLKIWKALRDLSEKIANSWQEWVYGKIRIINHGFYVGFAALAGIFFAGYIVGPDYAWAILVFILIVIVVAALWAQIIEGSEKLKRPFGFYGGLVGMIFSSITVGLMGYNVWVVVGVITIFLPWAQAIGRLRCFVNGCCHGSKIDDPHIGIRYFHFRSRVCGISGLKGELLHPTQLYSIIWLFFVGFVLMVLWNNQFSPSFILGIYLMLNGIGRFVEEAFRGEVQTVVLKGLRLYQWTAIISIIIGMVFTIVPSSPIVASPAFGWEVLIAALIGGLCTCFAMGVDFPESNARFSRLV